MITNLPELIVDKKNPFMNCKLSREGYANILTQIVSKYEKGGVVAINGKWGIGKTTFVRMWKQSLENDGFETLYFNVWKDDYITDPLIGLIAQMQLICKTEADKERFSRMVDSASKIMASAFPAILKGFTKKIIGEECADVVYDSLNNIADGFKKEIANYHEQHHSVEGFRKLISEFVASCGSDKPVIFMVDELDRCNPSYAVKVLERIKHLFDIPNIVFVLSIDKVQLCSSIRGYYGTDAFNAEEYLQRFINLEYHLPEPNFEVFCKYLYEIYGYSALLENGNYRLHEESMFFLSFSQRLFKKMGLSLREMDRIYAHASLTLQTFDRNRIEYLLVLVLLIYIRKTDIDFYIGLKGYKLTLQQIIDYFESETYKDVFLNDDSRDNSLMHSIYALVEFISMYSKRNYGLKDEPLILDDGNTLAFECRVFDKEEILYVIRNVCDPSQCEPMSYLFNHIDLLTSLKDV